ncbi:MAG: hypothetical protein ACLU80_01575 [Dorea sp.]
MVQSDPDRTLSPEEIAAMDWLADNVIGEIPTSDELRKLYAPRFFNRELRIRKVK